MWISVNSTILFLSLFGKNNEIKTFIAYIDALLSDLNKNKLNMVLILGILLDKGVQSRLLCMYCP